MATEIKAEQVSGYRGNQNLDDLIEYIEGSPVNAQHKASSKSAKRQRQKQKKVIALSLLLIHVAFLTIFGGGN